MRIFAVSTIQYMEARLPYVPICFRLHTSIKPNQVGSFAYDLVRFYCFRQISKNSTQRQNPDSCRCTNRGRPDFAELRQTGRMRSLLFSRILYREEVLSGPVLGWVARGVGLREKPRKRSARLRLRGWRASRCRLRRRRRPRGCRLGPCRPARCWHPRCPS